MFRKTAHSLQSLFGGWVITAILLVLFTVSASYAQQLNRQFDYKRTPKLPYNIKSLELDLNIQPEPLHLDGVARYTIVPRIDSIHTMTMDAIEIDIQEVEAEDRSVEYTVHNDTLAISFAEAIKRGEEVKLLIRYRATPGFGILRDTSGTLWTSRLPRSNPHWLPVRAHPRVTFRTNLNITVPSAYTVMANGKLVQEKAVSVDTRQYRFRSKTPIPATELGFLAGPLKKRRISYGVKSISGYFPPDVYSDSIQKDLMNTAYESLEAAEKLLGREYPYPVFRFAVLPDQTGESKNYAASLGLLYENRGKLKPQLRRTIWAQWFGTWHREEQWVDPGGILLHQAWMGQALKAEYTPGGDKPDTLGLPEDPLYSAFRPERLKRWRVFWRQPGRERLKQNAARLAPVFMRQDTGVFSWKAYAEKWYRRTGMPWFEVPRLPELQPNDSSKYRVTIHYQTDTGQLSMNFEALSRPLDELVTLQMHKVSAGTIDTQKATFTGKKDSLVFSKSSGLQNVYLENVSDQPLKLEVRKPKSFWIHQLQNAKDKQRRIQAARGLRNYSGEPDLQLLLNQVLKQESSARVRASIYRTLGKVLKGAAGTEETFLSAIENDNLVIQEAALSALRYYEANRRVQAAVRRVAVKSSHVPLVRSAIHIYSDLTSDSTFAAFAHSYIKEKQTAEGLVALMNEWIQHNGGSEALQQAVPYTSDEFTFRIRSHMIHLLTVHKFQGEEWLKKIPNLLQDLDPRIRYLTVKSLDLLPGSKGRSLAKERQSVEYDVRVLERLNQYTQ